MVQKIAQDGMLVVTWANWHYQDFVRTWIKHVQAVGITGYIVGAMDDHLLQVCHWQPAKDGVGMLALRWYDNTRLSFLVCTTVHRSSLMGNTTHSACAVG
jgi:hypothetical protein